MKALARDLALLILHWIGSVARFILIGGFVWCLVTGGSVAVAYAMLTYLDAEPWYAARVLETGMMIATFLAGFAIGYADD